MSNFKIVETLLYVRDQKASTRFYSQMKKIKLIILIFIEIGCSDLMIGQNVNPSNRYVDEYKKYENAAVPLIKDSIKHFVYFARDRELIHNHVFLKTEWFKGAQIMYPWSVLEPQKGVYDFSVIEEDYEYLKLFGKKLFIQFQDATFNPKFKAVPEYLLTDEFDGGVTPQYKDNGQVEGWVAKRWNPNVQKRLALLLKMLGEKFDGKIEGINFQESSISVNNKSDKSFSPDKYVESLKINMLALKKAFPNSTTMQYANFMPDEWLPGNDKGYLRSIYKYGQKIGVGLGAPDLMVNKRGQLNHALAMMHEGIFDVPLGIAVQDGNFSGSTGLAEKLENGKPSAGHKNIVPMLHSFAKDFLRVKYMFWSNGDPYFNIDLIPVIGEDNTLSYQKFPLFLGGTWKVEGQELYEHWDIINEKGF